MPDDSHLLIANYVVRVEFYRFSYGQPAATGEEEGNDTAFMRLETKDIAKAKTTTKVINFQRFYE